MLPAHGPPGPGSCRWMLHRCGGSRLRENSVLIYHSQGADLGFTSPKQTLHPPLPPSRAVTRASSFFRSYVPIPTSGNKAPLESSTVSDALPPAMCEQSMSGSPRVHTSHANLFWQAHGRMPMLACGHEQEQSAPVVMMSKVLQRSDAFESFVGLGLLSASSTEVP